MAGAQEDTSWETLGWYLGELAENAQSAPAPALAEVRTGNRFQALTAEDDDGPVPPPPTAEHRGQASACVSCSEACGCVTADSSSAFVNPRWITRRSRQRGRRAAVKLAALYCEAPEAPLVAPVVNPSRTRVIEAVVDSGAEESVAPPDLFNEEVVPSVMSREGRCYRAANGSPIENLGQMVVRFKDEGGRQCGIPFQVAAVDRPLISVSLLVAAGCRVTFHEGEGEILHVASSRRLPLVRRNGVYVLELRVSTPEGQPGGRKLATTPFFPGRGDELVCQRCRAYRIGSPRKTQLTHRWGTGRGAEAGLW